MRRQFSGLLALDIDGTLLGDEVALSQFNQQWNLQRRDRAIAYVTGRNLKIILPLINTSVLLVPDVIISDVGASIHWPAAWQSDRRWQHVIDWQWNPKLVEQAASHTSHLVKQPESAQSKYKCSYYLSVADAPLTLARLDQSLARLRIKASLIYSGQSYLDILPARAGKGNALRYVAESLSLPLSAVLACGDSGNDIDMLASGCSACLVGNADPETRRSLPKGVYRANSGFAAGICEALAHFSWE